MVSSDLTVGVALPDLLGVGLLATDGRLHQLVGEELPYGTMLILGTSLGVVALVRGSNVVTLSASLSMVTFLCFTTLHATGNRVVNSGCEVVPE